MQKQRLLSLDVLRGITIAGMIMVNNPGSWGAIYAPLRHAEWDGLTPTDLVFPFFMFIMGVSMYISYSKFDFNLNKGTFIKLLRRSALLFLIGLLLNWFGLICRHMSSLSQTTDYSWFQRLYESAFYYLQDLRILGVLQRLAIVNFCGSLILLTVKKKYIPFIVFGILLCYSVVMVLTGSLTLSETNIIAQIDNMILGSSHMYKINGMAFDPEGLFSTIPCIAHVLIGVMAGSYILSTEDNKERMEQLFIFGTLIMVLGFLWHYYTPINKTLWSSSYTLVTCGLASLLLSILLWIIDVKGYTKPTRFFEAFGVNPMAIFVLGGIMSNLVSNIGITLNDGSWISFKGLIHNHINVPIFGDKLGSLVFALGFILVCYLIALPLYKKKIYIKI